MHFLSIFLFIYIAGVCSIGPVGNKTALFQVMAWHRRKQKANHLSEPTITQSTGEYMFIGTQHVMTVSNVKILSWTSVLTETSGLILGLCPANEMRRYKVTQSLIGWAQNLNQLWTYSISSSPDYICSIHGSTVQYEWYHDCIKATRTAL